MCLKKPFKTTKDSLVMTIVTGHSYKCEVPIPTKLQKSQQHGTAHRNISLEFFCISEFERFEYYSSNMCLGA